MSAEAGNDRNDRNSDPSGDEAILNGGRRRFVFQKDLNFLHHAGNVGRSSERSVNRYRQTTVGPCDRMALVSTARPSRHSGNLFDCCLRCHRIRARLETKGDTRLETRGDRCFTKSKTATSRRTDRVNFLLVLLVSVRRATLAAMRSLFLLTAVTGVLLAFDAAEFSGQYRKAVWHEAGYQFRMLQYQAERYLYVAPL